MSDPTLDYVEAVPAGFDRADGGVTFDAGTPTLWSAIPFIPFPPPIAGGNTIFEEMPDSPEIERAEQATFTHKFKVDWGTAIYLLGAYPRGAMTQDSFGYVYRILNSRLTHEKAGMSVFAVTMESISFDVPPDEFTVDEIELNPPLWRHPLFAPVLNYNQNPITGEQLDTAIPYTGDKIIQGITNAINLPQSLAQADAAAGLNGTNIPDFNVLSLTKLLLMKMRRGEDPFYLAGFKITWSQYFFIPPQIFPGGDIEDPFGSGTVDTNGGDIPSGGLPAFFWSDTGDIDGNNIFTYLAELQNPNIYGNGISWLRLCDHLEYARTWFKLTRSWQGGPLGHWDADIYGNNPPQFTG